MWSRVVLVVPGLSDGEVKRKAMSIVYSLPGVESVAVDVRNKLTVTGVDLNVVGVAVALRKSCGFAELVSVVERKSGRAEEPESKNSKKQQQPSFPHSGLPSTPSS